MTDSFGIGTLAMLIIIAAILVGVAVVLVRFRLIPPLNFSIGPDVVRPTGVRLEVVESTVVDARRSLVLVRRDDVEHLIMIGGPVDLVVENAVERRRLPLEPVADMAGAPLHDGMQLVLADLPAAPPPVATPETRTAEPAAKPGPEARPRIEPRPVEARGVASNPASGRSAIPPRSAITVVPGPAAPPNAKDGPGSERAAGVMPRNGASKPAEEKAAMQMPPLPPPAAATPARAGEPPRRPAPQPSARPAIQAKPQETSGLRLNKQRVEPPQAQPTRLEPSAIQPGKRPPPAMPAPPAANQPAAARDAGPSQDSRQERGSNRPAEPPREAQKPVSLPAAEVPWPEPDSFESEIGTALRADVQPQKQAGSGAKPASRQEEPGRTAGNSPTTLGDLAERLEEALAREVHGVNNPQSRPQYDLESFGLTPDAPALPPVIPAERPAAKDERKDRPEPAKLMAPAPEPELRRDARPTPEPRRDARPPPEAETKRDARPVPERQEDAPVISLNARRPQTADPLEDEMARLLGELTGDTNRR